MSETHNTSAKDGGIQVIARAVAVLRALEQEGSSLGTLAKATGLPRSTVQRIVDSLAAENLVETGDTGVRPGWGLQQLAQKGQSMVAQRVRPHLQALFEATHETVDISTFHGRQVTFLDRIISDQELRVVPINDRPRPLHAMANGKAMLSCLNDRQLAAMLPDPFTPLTAHTVSSLADLKAELRMIRSDGFSYDREEHVVGICAIGTPLDVPGLQPHAISAVMPVSRFEDRLPLLRDALHRCRVDMEAALRAP